MPRESTILRCVRNALRVAPLVLTPDDHPELLEEEDLRIASWPQGWNSSTCGFPGVGLAAMTDAQTVTVRYGVRGPVAVFHNGRLARLLSEPDTRAYHASCASRTLPGAEESDRWAVLGSPEGDVVIARRRLCNAVRRYVPGAEEARWVDLDREEPRLWVSHGQPVVNAATVETGEVFERLGAPYALR
jgi:hypothetical protein